MTKAKNTDLVSLRRAFDSANQPLVVPVDALLRRVISDRPLHARFLNTLAMLEHMGSQKIMATQHGPDIDQPTLKHLAEEARHAFFFKRAAEREAGRPLEAVGADFLSPLAARRYFGRLEAEVVEVVGGNAHRRIPYLLMSLVVEFRAAWAYGLYQAALSQSGHALSLKSLLAEETGHLSEMTDQLVGMGAFDPKMVEHLCGVETSLYRRFFIALESSVSGAPQSIAAA